MVNEPDLIDGLTDRVEAWVTSPEGAKALMETAQRIRASSQYAKKLTRLDHEKLRKPMTI